MNDTPDFKLIIFDWDGTLMDSEPKIVASAMAAAHDLALPALAPERVRNIIGLGLPEAEEIDIVVKPEELSCFLQDSYVRLQKKILNNFWL